MITRARGLCVSYRSGLPRWVTFARVSDVPCMSIVTTTSSSPLWEHRPPLASAVGIMKRCIRGMVQHHRCPRRTQRLFIAAPGPHIPPIAIFLVSRRLVHRRCPGYSVAPRRGIGLLPDGVLWPTAHSKVAATKPQLMHARCQEALHLAGSYGFLSHVHNSWLIEQMVGSEDEQFVATVRQTP